MGSFYKRFSLSLKNHSINAFGIFLLILFFAHIVVVIAEPVVSKTRREAPEDDFDSMTTPPMVSNRKKSKYSCADKEDDGHYEHVDCKKYWHCLYVGTIFEYALERKCPVGTMFHPIQRVCEISTVVSKNVNEAKKSSVFSSI